MNNTVKDLKQIAGALEIPGRSRMNKDQLVSAITQAGGGHYLGRQRGGAFGAPFYQTHFGQSGGTGMPWQWYHPSN